MDPQPEVYARLDELAAAMARLERRVASLERSAPRPAEVVAAPPETDGAPAPPRVDDTRLLLTLVGRSVIVMGGAFLLRAVANLEPVPDALGVGLGLAYAAVLLALADRAAARGHDADSAFHGATALLVAYPLFGEMMLRFAMVDAWMGSVAVCAWFALTSLVAARRRAAALAWILVCGTLIALVALAFATRTPVPYVWAIAALAAGTGWLGHRLEQRFLVWPVAITGDLLLLAVLPIVLLGRSAWGAATVPALALVYFLVFAGGAMARAIALDAATSAPEKVQATLTLALGFIGGAWTATVAGAGVPFGAIGLALALAGTAVALRWLGAREGTLWFWTSVWLAAALAALVALAPGPVLTLPCVAAGLILLGLGRRRTHALAGLHAVAALIFAAASSGLLALAWGGLVGPPRLVAPGAIALLVLAALAAAAVLLLRDRDPEHPRLTLTVELLVLGVSLFSAAGVLATAGLVTTHASPAVAATLRTAVLAAGAVACAAASRWPRARTAGLLVYPLLLAGAAKLVLEDFVVGVAATQFVGLALFGTAVIVAPRLRRR